MVSTIQPCLLGYCIIPPTNKNHPCNYFCHHRTQPLHPALFSYPPKSGFIHRYHIPDILTFCKGLERHTYYLPSLVHNRPTSIPVCSPPSSRGAIALCVRYKQIVRIQALSFTVSNCVREKIFSNSCDLYMPTPIIFSLISVSIFQHPICTSRLACPIHVD